MKAGAILSQEGQEKGRIRFPRRPSDFYRDYAEIIYAEHDFRLFSVPLWNEYTADS